MSKTVIQIVREGLKADGYSGLVAPDNSCGCALDDLQPCAGDFSGCVAGYKHCDPLRPGVWSIFRSKETPSQEVLDGIED
jgi:hypothetical protein